MSAGTLDQLLDTIDDAGERTTANDEAVALGADHISPFLQGFIKLKAHPHVTGRIDGLLKPSRRVGMVLGAVDNHVFLPP